MRVELHAADGGGCGRYRLAWPGEAVAASGAAEVRVRLPEGPDNPELPTWWLDGRVVGLRPRPEGWPDVLVLQRPLRWELVEAARALRAEGVAVVVELDDAFDVVSPRSAAWTRSMPSKVAALRTACAEADLVTVSTPALTIYAPHGRVAVLPNLVPPPLAARPPARREHAVGWTGSVRTHVDDLPQVRPALARTLRATGAEFRVVGTGEGVAAQAGRRVDRAAGWRDLADPGPDGYYAAVAELGIGLAPLAPSAFNEAKSWLKPLEYAACGLPAVVSPTSEYARLARDVPGVFVAEDAYAWRRELHRLLTDGGAWAEAAEGAYTTVREKYTLADHAHLWAEAWTAAATYRREHG